MVRGDLGVCCSLHAIEGCFFLSPYFFLPDFLSTKDNVRGGEGGKGHASAKKEQLKSAITGFILNFAANVGSKAEPRAS